MTPYAYFFIGIIIVIIIIFIFWLLATYNQTFYTAYSNSLCYKICPT